MKPYYLYQRNGTYYVSFYDEETGTKTTKKSTGTGKKSEADKIAQQWLLEGIPKDKRKKEEEKTTVEFKKLLERIALSDLTEEQVSQVQELFKRQDKIDSYVAAKTPSSEKLVDFLERFWNWETSPYIQEKKMYHHSIHKYYVKRNHGYVEKHYRPFFKDISLGAVTKQDIKSFMKYLTDLELSPESINQITRAVTTALKWAYNNELTQNNCFEGLTFVAVTHKHREVLTLEQASAVFAVEWKTEYSRLANLTAMCTGMRAGEIQALRLEDIGVDRLYVRHAWDRGENCLKTPKNGEAREVPIPPQLRDLLLKQANSNPYNEGLKGFVFYGLIPGQPMDAKRWLVCLRDALSKIGYSDPNSICFHAWRHLYSARMADFIDQRKLQRATGHKTAAMLEHYANHAKEQDFADLATCANNLFLPIVDEF